MISNRLKLLKSDLKDSHNLKILKKYSHLGNPVYVKQLEDEIKKLEKEKDDSQA